MIGGGGERKTLRMVAQYADESNLIAAKADLPRKLAALDEHCASLGRDRAEITVSWQRNVCVAPTMEEATSDLTAYLATRGMDLGAMSDDERAAIMSMIVVGDADTVGEVLADDLTVGVDGFTIAAPANGHLPGRVTLLGETAAKVIA